MSVYLDPMVNRGKRIGRAGPRWSHMIADTLDELHAMADRIGLRRAWFQRESFPHYDIGTDRVRALAVAAGAIECDRRVFVEHMRRVRRARSLTPETIKGLLRRSVPSAQELGRDLKKMFTLPRSRSW